MIKRLCIMLIALALIAFSFFACSADTKTTEPERSSPTEPAGEGLPPGITEDAGAELPEHEEKEEIELPVDRFD